MSLSSYDYELDDSYIAAYPANPRSSAKLLVYDRESGLITHTVFSKILDFIPHLSAVIYNDTRVIKARIFGRKESGGAVELLVVKALLDGSFTALIKGRVRVGSSLLFDLGVSATVAEVLEDGSRRVFFTQNGNKISSLELFAILESIGHIPLPPYIARADEKDDSVEYQSVFAQNAGSVAAPTASLHFDDELFAALRQKHESASVTLHIGLGTFKPVESEQITQHPMHSEYFRLNESSKKLIDSGKKLLCIGTTATRVVEHYARNGELEGECRLFLHPQNRPVRTDYLLTNFHLPRSTLLMLVASFLGIEQTMRVYEEAKAKGYRFFSYGDAMLIV